MLQHMFRNKHTNNAAINKLLFINVQRNFHTLHLYGACPTLTRNKNSYNTLTTLHMTDDTYYIRTYKLAVHKCHKGPLILSCN